MTAPDLANARDLLDQWDRNGGLPAFLWGGWITHTAMHNAVCASVGLRMRVGVSTNFDGDRPDHRYAHRTMGRMVRILVPDMPPEPPVGPAVLGEWHGPHHEWLIDGVRRILAACENRP